jgi:hypothetical protein
MDRIEKNKAILISYLENFLAIVTDEENPLTTQLVKDETTNTYLVITYGWLPDRFVHYVVFHFQLQKNGVVSLYQNRTTRVVLDDLLELGVARADIELVLVNPVEDESLVVS